MQSISLAKDIYPVIGNSNGTHTFMSAEMQDSFIVDGKIYHCRWLVFENVTFINQVMLSDLSVGAGIKFIGCHFQNSFTLNNIVSTSDEDIAFDENRRSIVFERCTFYKQLVVSGDKNTLARHITFGKCLFQSSVTTANIEVKNGSIEFNECEILGTLEIHKCRTNGKIQLNCSKVTGKAIIARNNFYTLELYKSNFDDFLFIQQNKCSIDIAFNGGIYKRDISLSGNNASILSITGGQFQKAIQADNNASEFDHAFFETIVIVDANFMNGFTATGNVFANPIEKTVLTNIEVVCSAALQGDIHFKDFEIGVIRLSGLNTKANIVFSNIGVNQLLVENFYNYAQVVLTNVYGSHLTWYYPNTDNVVRNNYVHWVQTNFGKAHLYQVDFSNFYRLVIINTVLIDIVTSNVKWFDSNKLVEVDGKTLKSQLMKIKHEKNTEVADALFQSIVDDLSIRRELYRQLKYAMEKNGDRPQALVFQSLEMDYYRKFKKLSEKGNCKDRFILFTSRSNDFGQNWWKPTLLLAAFSTILFIPIGLCASGRLLCAPADDWQQVAYTFEMIRQQLHLLPQLLNPTHNLASMLDKGIDVSGWIYLFDFFHRIITAYFIFQIVTAFRKYVR